MEIHPIDKIVIGALKNSNAITLIDFGGIEYLKKNIENIYTSRFLPEILKIIVVEIEKNTDFEMLEYENILLTSLRFCNDEFSIQEVIRITQNESLITSNYKNSIFSIYLEESKNLKKKAIVRSWFLEAAFRVSLSEKNKRFKLISHLIEISVEDNDLYLKHVSKILGLSYSSWQEEELIGKLDEIKSFEKGLDEVWFELGMCYLLLALNSTTNVTTISNFILAKDHFKKAIELNSERPDAVAYEASISILLSLNGTLFEIDRSEKLNEIKKAVIIYSTWHKSDNESVWMSARNTEMANWCILINKLNKLLIHLTEPCWFEPKIVIENYLLNIYTASRTILKRNQLGGLEKIIQPQIVNSLRNKVNQLFLLDQWVSTQGESELGEIGKDLKQEITFYKSELSEGLFNTIPSIAKLTITKQSEFEKFVLNYKNQNTNSISIHIEQIFNQSISSLSTISDFNNEDVKMGFNELLYLSLQFLISRMDGTKLNHKDFSYLFEQKTKPLEIELQKDYHQYMNSTLLHGNTTVEKNDVAGGRVDVYFSFGKFNISAEIKRDFDDCSFEAIRAKYLGQAAEYSNTDVKLGFLLVLDLTPKPSGIRSIESSVKIEIVEKENDPVKRAIVVIVVPGMRKTPSNVKI
jgi:hypothetical protein